MAAILTAVSEGSKMVEFYVVEIRGDILSKIDPELRARPEKKLKKLKLNFQSYILNLKLTERTQLLKR